MGVKKFSADHIFDGCRFLPEDTVIVIDEFGKIGDVLIKREAGDEVQQLRGILLPGLINAHCHLELSHFKGQIAPGGGLVKFLLSVIRKRKEPCDEAFKLAQIRAAAAEMAVNGIIGVGDICNTNDAIDIKLNSGLMWHNLVEVLNFSDETVAPRIAHNQAILAAHVSAGLCDSVLTPHAPYSVSPATFQALNKASAGKVISVHNQEAAAETQLFKHGGGDFSEIYRLTGTQPLGPSGKGSLQTWLPYFTEGQTIVLVHNTFMQREDVLFAREHAARHNLKLVICLCPNANLYIEEKLPPLNLFLDEHCTIVLGTDSYSSNWQLSIASEIKLLVTHFPEVPLEVLLRAATKNAASTFRWTDLGEIKKGAKPGLALLHMDDNGVLTGTSEKVV